MLNAIPYRFYGNERIKARLFYLEGSRTLPFLKRLPLAVLLRLEKVGMVNKNVIYLILLLALRSTESIQDMQ